VNSALFALALILSAPGTPPRAQQRLAEDERHAREAPVAEGALDNDVFVAVAEAPLLAALAEGDRALERARAAGLAAERERQLDLAFDGWHTALAGTGAGARLWLDAPGREARSAEGLHASVLRRLIELGPEERARHAARFGPPALAALEEARRQRDFRTREARLFELLRAFPGTRAAALAVLELLDHALEAGQGERARALLARGEREGKLAGDDELAAALARRRVPVPRAEPAREAWQDAEGMVAAGAFAFETRELGLGPAPERRMRPGAAFLAGGRFVLQTPQELLCFAPGPAATLAPYARVRPLDLLEGVPLDLSGNAPREAPGWPLLPLADAAGVVLVVGRALPEDSNALVALTLAEPRENLGLGLDLGQSRAAAGLSWALVGSRLFRPDGMFEIAELDPLGAFEFQPGPVFAGGRVLVQVRTDSTPVEAWLLALERQDGRLAWMRPLARGADRVSTARLAKVTKRVAAQPLLAFERDGETRLFAGTHLGLGVLVDTLDGELLWSFKNRRRPEREPGWGGDRPLIADGETPAILWAPMDSDRLYALTPERIVEPTDALFLRPPAPLADAQTLLGGSLDEHLVTSSRGKERTVSLRRSGRDRIDALDLGQHEQFRGQGLVSGSRVWVATNFELLLLDRERELYRLDNEPLAALGSAPLGGDVCARGDEVLVVGTGAVWRFRTR
jgi:hypothetical protein